MAEGESALHNDLAACDSYKNGETAAKALQKPVLVVSGSHDKMVKPEFSAAFAQMFPAGRLLRLEETGHMMPVENPSATATALDGFIAGITKV
jgi:pimeloyl-ACP methyl ester carboxylesterase